MKSFLKLSLAVATALSLSLAYAQGANTDTSNTAAEKVYTIQRVFKKGVPQKHKSNFLVVGEFRSFGSSTFMPVRFVQDSVVVLTPKEVTYDGTADVTLIYEKGIESMSGGGGAFGKDYSKDLTGSGIHMTLTPASRIIDIGKEIKPPKTKKALELFVSVLGLFGMPAGASNVARMQFEVIGAVYRVSALLNYLNITELGPVLPSDDVKIGDTWTAELGFVPGKKENPRGGEPSYGLTAVTCVFKLVSVANNNGVETARINASWDQEVDQTLLFKSLKIDDVITDSSGRVTGNLDWDVDVATGIWQKATGETKGEAIYTQKLPDPSSASGFYNMTFGLKINGILTGNVIKETSKPAQKPSAKPPVKQTPKWK